MVMAGTEGVSATATDEFFSNRLQWLCQRRETLQDKLAKKNSELRILCIKEAELTGVLPPEIPLEPGESPPAFRKRVGTSFNYPPNLINKLRTHGSEESDLELERQAQINIADRALAVLNDPNESKAVRRKHRSIYQQSQRRVQELNLQLNFIRQSLGSIPKHAQSTHTPIHSSQTHLQPILKHRTKKPRPPLDTSGKDLSPKLESQGLLQEGGISLSPLSSEHNYNSYQSYDYHELPNQPYPQSSTSNLTINQNQTTYHSSNPMDNRYSNSKFTEHDVNVNIYVTPEQFRNRTYSQGGNSSNSVSPHHVPDRVHRSVPNTYTEEERQIHYRQMKLKKHDSEEINIRNQQYPDQRHLDNEVHRRSAQRSYCETDFNNPHYEGQLHELSDYYHQGKCHQPPILRQRDTVDNATIGSEHKGSKPGVDAYIPPGYWIRLNDEIVWCSNEEHMNDRFGSLDRRKHNVMHPSLNAEMQSRYHTVAIGGKNIMPQSRPCPMQMHSPSTTDQPSNNRILLRTQSLGSVETWQSTPGCLHDTSSVEGRESTDGSICGNKPKEKEWYETSLDSSGPTVNLQQPNRTIKRASQHNAIMGSPTKDRVPVRSNSIPSNRRVREQYQKQKSSLLLQQQLEEQQALRPTIPQDGVFENRVLEIPAESKPTGSQENGNETTIPLNSPLNSSANHTVVQPGKYQPYREVTKPFEMSDFYKYSTKFRRRVEENEQQQQLTVNLHTQNDQNQPNNPIQKINQPIQQNTCPPYNLR